MFIGARMLEKNTGEFFLRETCKWFTFEKNTEDNWGSLHGLTHKVDVLDGQRYAKVLKTVAYIAVDEDPNGQPVLEKWEISRLKIWHH